MNIIGDKLWSKVADLAKHIYLKEVGHFNLLCQLENLNYFAQNE